MSNARILSIKLYVYILTNLYLNTGWLRWSFNYVCRRKTRANRSRIMGYRMWSGTSARCIYQYPEIRTLDRQSNELNFIVRKDIEDTWIKFKNVARQMCDELIICVKISLRNDRCCLYFTWSRCLIQYSISDNFRGFNRY